MFTGKVKWIEGLWVQTSEGGGGVADRTSRRTAVLSVSHCKCLLCCLLVVFGCWGCLQRNSWMDGHEDQGGLADHQEVSAVVSWCVVVCACVVVCV